MIIKVYVGDMIAKNVNKIDYIEHLLEAFEVLTQYNRMSNLAKCIFSIASRKFLELKVEVHVV